MMDYSSSVDDNGKYHIYYEPPLATDAVPPKNTYLQSIGLRVAAIEFEDRLLISPEPDGWGYSVEPSDTCYFAIEPGPIDVISAFRPATRERGVRITSSICTRAA